MATLESLNEKIDTLISLVYAVRNELLAKIDEKVDEKVDELAAVTAQGFLHLKSRLDHLEEKVFA